MAEKYIIGFSGEIASGKGTAAKYLHEKYGANVHRFSTILRDLLDRLHLPHTRDNIQQTSTALRGIFGEDLLAKVIFEDVKNDPADIVVVDGVRRPDDIRYLKTLPGFRLVYMEADMERRHKRITVRGENADDNTKTFEEFKKDHERETEVKIKELRPQADVIIDNNGEMEDLHAELDALVKNK